MGNRQSIEAHNKARQVLFQKDIVVKNKGDALQLSADLVESADEATKEFLQKFLSSIYENNTAQVKVSEMLAGARVKGYPIRPDNEPPIALIILNYANIPDDVIRRAVESLEKDKKAYGEAIKRDLSNYFAKLKEEGYEPKGEDCDHIRETFCTREDLPDDMMMFFVSPSHHLHNLTPSEVYAGIAYSHRKLTDEQYALVSLDAPTRLTRLEVAARYFSPMMG